MSKLSSNQLQEYSDNGYVAPIDVLSENETIEIRKEIELIEQKFQKKWKSPVDIMLILFLPC